MRSTLRWNMSIVTANISDESSFENTLVEDVKRYKPIRDSLMHISLLTKDAKKMTGTTFTNMRDRVRSQLAKSNSE